MTRQELEDAGFMHACPLGEVPTIMPRKVSINQRALLVCRTPDGGASAVDELCPHKLESMAFGVVHDGRLICPHHQYSFDLETGRCSQRRCEPVGVYPVHVIEGEVFIKV